MAGPCPAVAPQGEFLRQLLASVDCHAQSIGAGGWAALASPSSAVSLVMAGVLTIFVALMGYRFLYGDAPTWRDTGLAAVKVGVVLMLATSWPAFRTLVYDVTLRGPAELAGTIGRPSALPGAEGGIAVRLQGVDNMLAELVVVGAGRPPSAEEMVGPTASMTPEQQRQATARLQELQQRARWDPAQEAKVLGQARTLFLAGAIAAYASVRLIAGLLLALGPLFALFLLFDATRGLFEGWVRGLAGAAFGAVATSVVLGVQLALLEPWMATVISARRALVPMPGVPIELLVMNLVFALVLLATLIATAKLAYSFRIPQSIRIASSRIVESVRAPVLQPALAHGPAPTAAEPAERARAFAIAEAVAATQRREALSPAAPATQLTGTGAARASGRGDVPPPPVRLGQTARRRTRARISSGAGRRDRQA